MTSKQAIGTGALCALAVMGAARPAHAKFPRGVVPQKHFWFSYGVRYTRPQEAALSLTLARAMSTDTFYTAGWFAQAEPGLGGGKLSVGYAAIDPSNHFWKPFAFAVGVKGSVLRTWGYPHGPPPGQTLVGPEVDLTFAYVKVSGGYLWRAGGAAGRSGRLTWGIGAGF